MRSPSSRFLALVLGVIAAAGCGETATGPLTTDPAAPDMDSPATAVTAAAANTWTTRQFMPRGRTLHATAAVIDPAGHSVVYSIAGVSAAGGVAPTVEAYDVDANTWSLKADLPERAWRTNGAGAIGGKVYVSGGLDVRRGALNALYVYDPATNTWTRKRSLPAAGFDGETAVFGNRLYVLTGCGAGGDCDDDVPVAFYRYDPGTDQWTTLAAPAVAHPSGVAGFIGGKFYVAGGDGAAGKRLDVYDPATNHWAAKAPLPNARTEVAGTALAGKLYVIGGLVPKAGGGETVVATTSVYDPGSNTWSHVAPLPKPSADYSASRVVRAGIGRIEAVGGFGQGNNLEYQP